ncbi:guanitoxin biosynthesis heme-dependent pre-guanitoxin N-hydroxylase GntA [Terrabacter sp. AAH1]
MYREANDSASAPAPAARAGASETSTTPEAATDERGLETTLDALHAMHLHHAPDQDVVRAMELMVTHAEFPCLGAKSVFRRGNFEHAVLDDMDGPDTPQLLLERLTRFADGIAGEDGFHSFIVTFRRPAHDDEGAFESSLFRLLQRLHDADDETWARGVGADPTDPHFAFSVAGTAYFIVGLHPAASRVARRAPLATLVFNPHDQFEQLRADGRFDGMRSTIRRRDVDLQGSVNPMVADHGESSEALQYSGRAHDPGWEPPLEVHPTPSTPADEEDRR